MISNSNFYSKTEEKTSKVPKTEPLDFSYELSLFIKTQKRYLSNEMIASQCLIKIVKIEDKEFCVDDGCKSSSEVSEHNLLTKIMNVGLNPEFKLYLHADIEEGICKGKYFSFKVILAQLGLNSYPSNEVVPLEVIIFNNDGLLVTKNMKGQDILRGNYKQNMHYFKPESKHVAYFRIQITEVSSHYVNKTVNLLIRAKESNFLQKTGWRIEPITVKNILVRAKKLSI